MSNQLLEPILQGGIRNINFFNGRVLTAEDLQGLQQANAQQHQQLGQAIGEGVVSGLNVTLIADGAADGNPVVQITPGLAICRSGTMIALPVAAQVSLIRQNPAVATGPGLFAVCTPPQTSATVTNADGYVLTVTPASGFQDSVPVREFGAYGTVSGCGAKYVVEGVSFRLLPLGLDANFLQDQNTLRNRLAHACFGTDTLAGFAQDPLHPPTTYGLIDGLRQSGALTDCEVPLAVLYWTQSSVQFVDVWSARRSLVPIAASDPWSLYFGARRRAEAEAMFYQFQQQIDLLAATNSASTAAATDTFRWLPPVGMIPVQAPHYYQMVTASSLNFNGPNANGFNVNLFFGALGSKDLAYMDGNTLRAMLQESLDYEPIDLQSGDIIPRYLIWENVQATARGQGTRVMVFASHTLPNRSVTRFGYGVWDVSRFAFENV